VSGCTNKAGVKKKNIIELTPKLVVSSSEPVDIKDGAVRGFYNASGAVDVVMHNLSSKKMIAEPLIVSNVVYYSDVNGNIGAYSLETKKTLWTNNLVRKQDHSNLIGGGIAHHEGKLYVTNGTRFLVALDAKTGNEIFRKEFADVVRTRPVLLSDKVVLVQTISNQLFAYDMEKVKILWAHAGIFESLSSSSHVEPIVYDGNIIASYSSGEVSLIDGEKGASQWTLNLSSVYDVTIPNFEPATSSSKPIIHNGALYIAGGADKLTKINLTSGAVLWQVSAHDIQSMSIIGNDIFVTNNARQAAILSTKTGTVKWAADMLKENKPASKSKATSFLAPFVSMEQDGYWLNVIASNGEVYSFNSPDGSSFLTTPKERSIVKGVNFLKIRSCCGKSYIATDKALGVIELN